MKQLTKSELEEYYGQNADFVDIRPSEDFASGFLSGSIFLFPDDHFLTRIQKFSNNARPAILITDSVPSDNFQKFLQAHPDPDKVKGYIFFDRKRLSATGYSIDLVIDVEPDELAMDLKFDENILLVDLRDPGSFAESHIEGATPMPLTELSDIAQLAALDEEGHVYFYADNPNDAYTAASLLKKQGLHDVRVISGGWKQILKEKSIRIVTDKSAGK